MNIFVTGGAGYIGTVTMQGLLDEGHHVTCYDNFSKGHDQINVLTNTETLNLIEGDVLNKPLLQESAIGHDLVIHLAGIVGYPECSANPKLAYDVNVNGTKNLLDALDDSQTIIHASTGSVYGDLGSDCTEESPVNPLSLYAQTKLDAERLISKRGNFVNLRLATVFGVSPRMRSDLLINNFVKTAVMSGELKVYQNQFKRTFINVNQLPKIFSFFINNPVKRNTLYNIGDDSLNYTKKNICDIIGKHIDVNIKYEEFDSDKDVRNYYVSYDKLNNAGIKVNNNIENNILDLITYYSAT